MLSGVVPTTLSSVDRRSGTSEGLSERQVEATRRQGASRWSCMRAGVSCPNSAGFAKFRQTGATNVSASESRKTLGIDRRYEFASINSIALRAGGNDANGWQGGALTPDGSVGGADN